MSALETIMDCVVEMGEDEMSRSGNEAGAGEEEDIKKPRM